MVSRIPSDELSVESGGESKHPPHKSAKFSLNVVRTDRSSKSGEKIVVRAGIEPATHGFSREKASESFVGFGLLTVPFWK